MANEKISQMPAISSFATGDLLPIVDISEVSASDKNKSVTFGALFQNVLGGSAAAPSIAFTGDQNTGIYSPGSDQLAVATNGTQRVTVDTAATTSTLPVVHPLGAAATPSITFTGDLNTGIYSPGADQVAISTGGAGRLFVDASGRVLVGTSSARTDFQGGAHSAVLQIEASSASAGNQGRFISQVLNSGATTIGPRYVFAKTRATSLGGATVVASGDELGGITFQGADGTNLIRAAEINAFVDGTPGTDDMPGRIVFSTTSDGSASPTERMRLDSSGRLGLGTSSPNSLFTAANGSIETNRTFYNRLASSVAVADRGLLFEIDGTQYGRVYAPNGKSVAIQAGAGTLTDALTVDQSGRVGIGTTSPGAVLHTVATSIGAATIGGFLQNSDNTAGAEVRLAFGPSTNTVGDNRYGWIGCINTGGSNGTAFTFATGPGGQPATERARIDGSGRLLVGTSSARSNILGIGGLFQQEGANNDGARMFSVIYGKADAGDPLLALGKHRSNSIGGTTIVNDGDGVGQLLFTGSDGTNFITAASIRGQVDGTPGTNDMPGRLVFSTTADGASSPTERLRITSAGNMLFGGTASPASATKAFAIFNGTAPTGSVADGVVLYAEDVSSSSELKVRDEAGNVTTLSPHNFDLIPDGPSEDMAWSYYSERDGKRINVDMLKAIRLLEQISGEKLVYSS